MDLKINRLEFTDSSTTGELLVNGVFECYTIEDKVRPAGEMVRNQTAIPAGRYEVVVNFSNRFQRQMPLLLGVPGYEGVRIHSGNCAADTEGCILLGLSRSRDWVGDSRAAFERFFRKLCGAISIGEKVFLEISNAKQKVAA